MAFRTPLFSLVTLSALLSMAPARAAAPALTPPTQGAEQALSVSTLRLSFDLSAAREEGQELGGAALWQGGDLLVAQPVPAGAKVVPGSSRLGDRPLPDPTRSARGVLYWTVPLRDLPAGASELSYQVTHTQAARRAARRGAEPAW
ncbi:hypothetical protein [Deinococcus radiodurans]|uniref:Uncharacterized protein DR_B0040 n=1 Tax=Deinococcus radiodurans (strain ATCC 13939 / DSM 20539 / JCM 16871 / CCUG 27074 / LMG 4051 / NBRC 15346 / NCIMB 9279 / VKM B-1422 / R1) TaxID=243230 RepID=Y3140_DEIRA|nr:hypothetical protein [Deinococcus radiodurans]Q9RZS4.1 RecName: Full=Uncharacterized protein DR_B0040 [Deinococcus radiodurans R1 = ATCC 13939 = DSM 20539]AAF12646.1 hypothetical protein DR_B0040 [Deinococcus radiodurans R1 = ATCC 13939 = DSM 20539]